MSHLEECMHGNARAEDCSQCVGSFQSDKTIDPAPVEGVVLPEVDLFVPACCGMDTPEPGQIGFAALYVRHPDFIQICKQLAEAIAQRDEARKSVDNLLRKREIAGRIITNLKRRLFGALDVEKALRIGLWSVEQEPTISRSILSDVLDCASVQHARAEKAEAALATARAEVNGWRERALNAESIINNGRGDTAAERSIDL